MSYACNILADSVGPHGIRLTTFEITFPRFILAELNTHRMLSRNSASSRAIPTEKQIDKVKNDPFIPEFNHRVKGMGVGEPLERRQQLHAQHKWLMARDLAVNIAEQLLHVDKSRANRLLEPFMWHTAIVSATDWENFFNLRCSPEAQPEFHKIAWMMKLTMQTSEPLELEYGDWHLPLVFDEDARITNDSVKDFQQSDANISAGRCARVSYDRQHDHEHARVSSDRWERCAASGHWSPGEHPARCVPEPVNNTGNFRGWKQLRKFYTGEDVWRGENN